MNKVVKSKTVSKINKNCMALIVMGREGVWVGGGE